MSFLVVMAIIVALLFACVYFTRRRLGVLGLALAAGKQNKLLIILKITNSI